MLLRMAFKVKWALISVVPRGYMLSYSRWRLSLSVRIWCNVNSYTTDEEGGVEDSDSSPPQSRGRGRFEKGRAKAGSRGQSEDSRSSTSQAADEESSSHVRQHHLSTNEIGEIYLSGLLALRGLLFLTFWHDLLFYVWSSGTGHLCGPAQETAASVVAFVMLAMKRIKREACFTPTTPKKWPRTTSAW